jgi:hypothetical protein
MSLEGYLKQSRRDQSRSTFIKAGHPCPRVEPKGNKSTKNQQTLSLIKNYDLVYLSLIWVFGIARSKRSETERSNH